MSDGVEVPEAPPVLHRAAVVGTPVAHSLSPELHRAAYRSLALRGWSYGRCELAPADLGAFIDGLDGTWAGLSLTMPLKRAVIPLLDDISDLARSVGAVNTLVLEGGRRHGANTDVHGVVQAVLEVTAAGSPGADTALGDGGGRATMVGAGATASSTLGALAQLGWTEVTVLVRDPARAAGLLEVAERLGMRLRLRDFDDAGTHLTGLRARDVVVSTVPAGAADPVAAAVGRTAGSLVDVIYERWPTRLATAWAAAGGRVVGGLVMLVHQAAEQVRLMTGVPGPVDVMRAAGEAALAERAGAGAGARH